MIKVYVQTSLPGFPEITIEIGGKNETRSKNSDHRMFDHNDRMDGVRSNICRKKVTATQNDQGKDLHNRRT